MEEGRARVFPLFPVVSSTAPVPFLWFWLFPDGPSSIVSHPPGSPHSEPSQKSELQTANILRAFVLPTPDLAVVVSCGG